MSARVLLAALAALLSTVGLSRAAAAQSLELRLESRTAYAGVPFALVLRAEGFDEGAAPQPPPLTIDGCQVEHLDTGSEVSSFVDLNRRTQVRRVIYNFRYGVTCPPGRYQVAPVTLEQGQAKARSRGGAFEVKDVPTTRDMQLRFELPERTVWVGETFEAYLDWYVRRDVSDQSFSVPLFDMPDVFQVSAPDAGGRASLRFQIGGNPVELPLERSRHSLDGSEYMRFRFPVRVTPQKPGTLEIPPAQVVAALEVGRTRDAFGFPTARTELFKAMTPPRTVQVKPLPMKGRPPSFANAVGSTFALDVTADRTVVRLGEPVTLTLRVRSDRTLEGLGLPPLEAILPADEFSVADATASGTLSADGKEKTFQVTVRLQSEATDKVPAIPFSYFDPDTSRYETVESQEIALSVKGSAVVGAGQVVGRSVDAAQAAPAAGGAPASLVGADLALGGAAAPVMSLGQARPYLALLYALPLLVLAVQVYRSRTRGRRDAAGEVKEAERRVVRAAEEAGARAARDAAPALVAALRSLARILDHVIEGDERRLLERLETEAFAPEAADRPLAEELRTQATELARRWGRQGRRRKAGPGVTAALVLVAAGAALPARAVAQPAAQPTAQPIDAHGEAQARYREALALEDRDARTRTFARAAAAFQEVAAERPRDPALLTDLGNAALGAGDLGLATLSYRRALALDPSADRARRNLAWVRDRQPAWLPRPASRGAVDSLFFWHDRLTRAQKHLGAAVAFALAILLVTPWNTRRRPLLRRLAIAPALVWLALVPSALLEPDLSDDAVVVADATVLRSADSPGAPAALQTPLPAGAEVTSLETRSGWTRVRLADGTTGWVPAASLGAVAPTR